MILAFHVVNCSQWDFHTAATSLKRTMTVFHFVPTIWRLLVSSDMHVFKGTGDFLTLEITSVTVCTCKHVVVI